MQGESFEGLNLNRDASSGRDVALLRVLLDTCVLAELQRS